MESQSPQPLTDQIPTGPPAYQWGENEVFMLSFAAVPLAENPRFQAPPESRPTDLFAVKPNRCSVPAYRFVRKDDKCQALLFTAGACVNSGRNSDARAGWAISVGPQRIIKGELESPGPEHSNNPHPWQMSNRAELWAVIVALQLRVWKGEGFDTMVIATDSEYVARGYSEWLPAWKRRKWKTARGSDVANKDMWQKLERAIQKVASCGTQVLFWQVPRASNDAYRYAQEAAVRNLCLITLVLMRFRVGVFSSGRLRQLTPWRSYRYAIGYIIRVKMTCSKSFSYRSYRKVISIKFLH